MPTSDLQRYLPYLIGVPIALLFLFFRLRTLQKDRRLRVEWLWVTPLLLAVVTVLSFMPAPPVGMDWAWIAVALALGAGFGWYRGKMMQISVDPQTHAVNTRASPAALYFIVVIILVRLGMRYVAMGEAKSWHVSATLITGLFVVFALGLLGVQRLEMFIRAQRLLADARANGTPTAAQTS